MRENERQVAFAFGVMNYGGEVTVAGWTKDLVPDSYIQAWPACKHSPNLLSSLFVSFNLGVLGLIPWSLIL